MSRINVVTADIATMDQFALLDAIQNKLGVVPNFLGVLANSTDALKAFLGLNEIADSGSLDPLTRERIALALAQGNSCEYCLSAHTLIGSNAGLSASERKEKRAGSPEDKLTAAGVVFAQALNTNLGGVTQSEFEAVRIAGYNDAEIVEIIVHVGMNILTNIIGKASGVAIDFPKVSLNDLAA